MLLTQPLWLALRPLLTGSGRTDQEHIVAALTGTLASHAGRPNKHKIQTTVASFAVHSAGREVERAAVWHTDPQFQNSGAGGRGTGRATSLG